MRASRNRLLAIAASLLLSGSAVAAAAILPAQAAGAATLPVNTVTVAPIAAQATTPFTATASFSATATETDQTAVLNYALTGLPATATTSVTMHGSGITSWTVKFAAPFSGTVTVTATAAATKATSGGTGQTTFAWTAANTVAFLPDLADQTYPVDAAIPELTVAATDNDPAATLTYTAGLPTGLAINPATGDVTGTPTAEGTYPVTFTATDKTGAAATSKTLTWVVTPLTIVVKATAPKSAWTGVPIKVQASATDSVAGQTGLTWSAKNLPAGLAISKTTGLIAGTVTAPVTRTATVTVTDPLGTTGSTTVAFKIIAAVIIGNPGPQTTTVGRWKLLNPIKTTDVVPGDKPTYSVTGLPAEMGFQASPMLFFGWPTTAGTYTVTVHEKGSTGSIGSMKFKLTVQAAPGKGATGQIHLALDGKCLRDPSGKTANGTAVRIENCASGANERFTVVADGTIRVNGRCLEVAGSGSSAGRQVVLDRCGQGNQRQRWSQSTDGELVNPVSGLCVADAEASTSNGIVPTMSGCHAQPYVQWTLPAQPVLTSLGGSCADLRYSSGTNGNIIDLWQCNGTASQAWTFEPGGTVRIFGSKCLTLRGTKAVIWTCGASSGQKWTVDRIGTMTSALTQNGVCLAIPSMTSANGAALEGNGTQLIASTCSPTDPRDLWHIA